MVKYSDTIIGGYTMGENYITCQEANGSINISEEVISTLVRAAVRRLKALQAFQIPPELSLLSLSA